MVCLKMVLAHNTCYFKAWTLYCYIFTIIRWKVYCCKLHCHFDQGMTNTVRNVNISQCSHYQYARLRSSLKGDSSYTVTSCFHASLMSIRCRIRAVSPVCCAILCKCHNLQKCKLLRQEYTCCLFLQSNIYSSWVAYKRHARIKEKCIIFRTPIVYSCCQIVFILHE